MNSRFAEWCALRPLVLVTLLLSACAPQPVIPPPLDLPARTVRVDKDAAKADTATSERRALTEDLPRVPIAAPRAGAGGAPPGSAPTPAAAVGGEVSLNFINVPLATFIQTVYADILKKNVNIAPEVLQRKELVTLRSGGGQTPEQVENATKLLLKSYGIAAIDVGGLVRVVPDNAGLGYLPEIRRGAALPDTPLPLRPHFYLVDLASVRNADVSNWLKTMFGDRVKVLDDGSRNAIMLSGTADNISAALDAIQMLDQPAMRGKSSGRFAPEYWSVEELARRLTEILLAEGYALSPASQIGQASAGSAVRFPMTLLPIPSIQTLLVFALDEALMQHVLEWARVLDRPNQRGFGKNFFIYAAQHKDAATLAKTLEPLLGGGVAVASAAGAPAAVAGTRRVVVDQASNSLIFQVPGEDFPGLMSLLRTIDQPARAALIEVTVAEIQLDDTTALGIEWAFQTKGPNGGTILGSTLGGLGLGTAGLVLSYLNSAGELRAILNTMATNNRASILSSPRVLARSGETATIQVGQEVPIITSQQSTINNSGQNPGILQTVQYRNTGVILKVRPVVHSSERIELDVSQEVSIAQETKTGVNNSPTFGTRKVETKLTLKNGSTVLLGGLIGQDNAAGDTGIPLLKDIPGIGYLFKSEQRKGRKTELIVLITPYVINDDADARAVTEAFRHMLGAWAAPGSPGMDAAYQPSAVPPVPVPFAPTDRSVDSATPSAPPAPEVPSMPAPRSGSPANPPPIIPPIPGNAGSPPPAAPTPAPRTPS